MSYFCVVILKQDYYSITVKYKNMNTIADKTEKKKINWLFPDENPADMVITVDDFREMVREAEKEKGMSLSEYKEKMNLWWQNHL